MITGALVAAAAGCEDDGAGTTGPEASAVIEGRVESTAAQAGSAGGGATAAQATMAAVARVSADGSVEVVTEAAVEASGTFRIEGVPAGRSDLVVVARNDAGAEVGRVLVHGETEADVVTVVAPINGETSVEGRAFAELRAEGHGEAAANSGGLAAFVRLSASEADALASTSAGVTAVAEAYAASETTLGASFGELGVALDAGARGEITTPLALQYAVARDGGGDLEATHEAFVQAVLDAYLAAGAGPQDLALATAAGASAAVDGAAAVGAGDVVAVVRQSVSTHIRARQGLSAEFSGAPGADAAVQALAQARANLEGAGTLAEIQAELDAVSATVEGAVITQILDLLGGVSLPVRSEVEAAIEAAFAEADLSARLAGADTPQARASVLASYRADVEAAAADVVAALPAGVSLDAQAIVALLIAASGSASVS